MQESGETRINRAFGDITRAEKLSSLSKSGNSSVLSAASQGPRRACRFGLIVVVSSFVVLFPDAVWRGFDDGSPGMRRAQLSSASVLIDYLRCHRRTRSTYPQIPPRTHTFDANIPAKMMGQVNTFATIGLLAMS